MKAYFVYYALKIFPPTFNIGNFECAEITRPPSVIKIITL